MKPGPIVTAALIAFASADAAVAQAVDHSAHMQTQRTLPAGRPDEPGDAAFAAIAEIVAMLAADPATDWSRVEIDALRRHLVDMNALVLGADVLAEPVPGGLTMRIAMDGRAGQAARRMVPAHAPVLAAETGWASAVAEDGDALVWTVTGDDDARIRALGFFGLMATGNHHPAHHLALAKGEPEHP